MAVVAPTLDRDARTLLVEMLRQASRLEHCLLNAYLFAASSVKSMPWEFDSPGGAQPNRRRGIQFEKARLWKQNILNVSHEEMLHLHYVQCLLRALGEAPDFSLPERDATGAWVVPDWRPQIGTTPSDGARVPVDKLDLQNAKRFVLYESTDSIQDEDPFGADSLALYAQLTDFELDLFLEGVVYSIPDEAMRAKLTAQLKTIYTSLTPYEGKAEEARAMFAATLPPGYEIRFQSIADLYNRGILPLYQQAFDFGWVKYSNLNLDNEQLNPNYAAQGFLPVGPVFRSPRFSRFARKNVSDPLKNYKTVDDIVREIVEEGEGFSLFRRRAEAMLTHVAANGGPRQFLTNLTKRSDGPEWMDEAQKVRMSHLYRFCLTLTDIQRETDLAHKSGGSFEPSRTPCPAGNDAGLRKLAAELPSVFNVCNLAMTAWLARMYEIREWLADTTRRQSIEMVATWPLMSLAIRPSLELCSFFEVDRAQLFRTDSAALPSLPVTARQLAQIYNAPERSEAINERMDYLAMRALAEVADWAREQCDAVENSALPANPKQMILNRLHALAKLDEFEKQFPFRVAGGYSSTLPDITYQNAHPGATDYSEDPSSMVPNAPNPVAVFEDSLVLRLRFAGWGQVQLSTDPDPPSDESGCTGTIMLHPADGPGARMDRALLWQDYSPNTILRTPAGDLPPLGVNCTGASLLVTDGAATAGYAPLFAMNSTGAVQASGVQQDLSISGLTEICSADAPRLKFYLETKQGVPPHLEGLNHLVWQDGEPLDPFILSIYSTGTDGKPAVALRREIFNDGRSILEMNPLQRIMTARAPCGFDSASNIPQWAQTPLVAKWLADPGFPGSYLTDRAHKLGTALEAVLQSGDTAPAAVDQIASYAVRMLLVSGPNCKGTTFNWLPVLLHYGHTVSGDMTVATSAAETVLSCFETTTNLPLSFAPAGDRSKPNSRWLAGYTKGIMDVDALRDFVYGELYIPLLPQATGATPANMTRAWRFPAGMQTVVADFASNFVKPFWGSYQVNGNARTAQFRQYTITETLTGAPKPDSYAYTISGIASLSALASFAVTTGTNGVTLTWTLQFQSSDPAAIVQLLTWSANSVQQMTASLKGQFAPA